MRTRTQAVGDAGIAFYFLFGVVYAFTYTPLRKSSVPYSRRTDGDPRTESLYPAECLETTTRAKGVSFKIFVRLSVRAILPQGCADDLLADLARSSAARRSSTCSVRRESPLLVSIPGPRSVGIG